MVWPMGMLAADALDEVKTAPATADTMRRAAAPAMRSQADSIDDSFIGSELLRGRLMSRSARFARRCPQASRGAPASEGDPSTAAEHGGQCGLLTALQGQPVVVL